MKERYLEADLIIVGGGSAGCLAAHAGIVSLRSVAINSCGGEPSRWAETTSKLVATSVKIIFCPSGETAGAPRWLVPLVRATRLPDKTSASQSWVDPSGVDWVERTMRRLSGIQENDGVPPNLGRS